MGEDSIVAAVRHILELFYRGEKFLKSKYYTENMVLIAPNISGRSDIELIHRDYKICLNREEAVCVTGSYGLFYTAADSRKIDAFCRYSALLKNAGGVFRIAALHITEQPGKIFCLTDVLETTYYLPESDVLYLESGHNRTLWHTGQEVIQVAGYLLDAEGRLPESFVRIHKSFIVNSLHVEKIGRCYVELSNGESLQIPVKRYISVRESLLESRERWMGSV